MNLFANALVGSVYLLFLVASVYIYLSLLRQIRARRAIPIAPTDQPKLFALAETVLAAGLVGWFLLNVAAAAGRAPLTLRTGELIAGAVLSLGLLVFVLVFLKFRGFHLNTVTGFSKIGFGRALTTAFVLLLFAWPLIILAEAVTRSVVRSAPSQQQIVEIFNNSQSLDQRIIIILIAVAIAPMAEEMIFRFFLYGVLRQYLGAGIALVGNALLFAIVHAHLPSLAALFILGSCFTLAYEWSGSLLVPTLMHALFNASQLTFLAFPQLFPQ